MPHTKKSMNCKWISLSGWGLHVHVSPCNITSFAYTCPLHDWLPIWVQANLSFHFISYHRSHSMFCFHYCTPHTEVIDIDLISMPFGALWPPSPHGLSKTEKHYCFWHWFKIPKEMNLFLIGCLEVRTNYLRFVQIQARHWLVEWSTTSCHHSVTFLTICLFQAQYIHQKQVTTFFCKGKLFIEFQEEEWE
jgi:hypothetical protein